MQYSKHTFPIELFSTCPPSRDADLKKYLKRVIRVARWSEEQGCEGILVYTDNSQVDPWQIAQVILENTRTISPLVAVQPVYMHPYWAAKIVTSLANLYGRRLYLNMVAGGFKNDLVALGDQTPHDQRYDRLVEYTTIVKGLLENRNAFSFQGDHYQVSQLKLKPELPPELFPGLFVSGSSEAGVSAARALGATAVKYPRPAGEEQPSPDPELRQGIRVGIIAREDRQQAWEVACRRFPPDRKGQLVHQLAMKVSDSVWHRQLSELASEQAAAGNPYWLVPFENYHTMCPYLVGSHEDVARELSRYIGSGYQTFILDIPASEEDLQHTARSFERALVAEVAS